MSPTGTLGGSAGPARRRPLPAALDRAPPFARNAAVAGQLREAADLLEAQGANPFRVRAYRRGADLVEGLAEPLAGRIARTGLEGLEDLPGIGPGLAAAIGEIVRTGRWSLLDRLRGTVAPEEIFRTLPGIGSVLARRIHEELGIDSLEELEATAHDGRLATVAGIGPRRAAGIAAALESVLRRRARPRPTAPPSPDVGLLLAIDAEYRARAAAGTLPTIAPRRFNPERRAWLPVLHATRDGWHFTALFSNTALAHRLDRTADWVVLYLYDDGHREDQVTVVTETAGRLAGRRVVRGREVECREWYEAAGSGAQRPLQEGLEDLRT